MNTQQYTLEAREKAISPPFIIPIQPLLPPTPASPAYPHLFLCMWNVWPTHKPMHTTPPLEYECIFGLMVGVWDCERKCKCKFAYGYGSDPNVQIYSPACLFVCFVCLVVIVKQCVRVDVLFIWIPVSRYNATTTLPRVHVKVIMYMHTPACINRYYIFTLYNVCVSACTWDIFALLSIWCLCGLTLPLPPNRWPCAGLATVHLDVPLSLSLSQTHMGTCTHTHTQTITQRACQSKKENIRLEQKEWHETD